MSDILACHSALSTHSLMLFLPPFPNQGVEEAGTPPDKVGWHAVSGSGKFWGEPGSTAQSTIFC